MRRLLPWLWPGVVVAALVALVITESDEFQVDPSTAVFGVVVVLMFTLLGSVILHQDKGNVIGWLMQISGFALLSQIAIQSVLETPPADPTVVDYLALIADINFGINFLIYPLLLTGFVFPDGHFLTRRWSWPAWGGAIFIPSILLLSIFTSEIGPMFTEDQWAIANPIGFIPPGIFEAVFTVWIFFIYLMAPTAVVALVVRYRRSDPEVKAQIRWVILGSIGFFITFVLTVFEPTDGGGLVGVLAGLGFTTIPISITIAITKYRLYEIDRLISRTIGYALVIALLAGIYLLGAVWLPTQLLDEQPPVFVAGSTLAAVGLFSPLRKRLLGWVDRRFYRSRYRAEQVIASFTERVRDEVTADRLAAEWEKAVTETLQPSAIGLWVRESRQ